MRLIPVCVNQLSDIKPTLQFFMGKNTPERKKFIKENLVNEVEEIKKLDLVTQKIKNK